MRLDRTLIADRPDIARAARSLERIAALSGLRCALMGLPVELPGLAALVQRRVGGLCRFSAPDLRVAAERGGIGVRAALWFEDAPSRGISFVNLGPAQGGVHMRGLLRALEDAGRATSSHGAVYGLHVTLAQPELGDPTRDWLTNPAVSGSP